MESQTKSEEVPRLESPAWALIRTFGNVRVETVTSDRRLVSDCLAAGGYRVFKLELGEELT